MALATPNQLWRLNKLGQLVVTPGSVPMTHVDADLAIKTAMATEEEWAKQNQSLDGLSTVDVAVAALSQHSQQD